MDVVSTDPVADFVTVVTVGTPEDQILDSPVKTIDANKSIPSAYVTVLKIGDADKTANDDIVENGFDAEITEEVLVYRLPGERLGFGLKFEGGTKSAEFVKRLFIQSCAPDSPASRVHSSWGCLTEGDEVLEIDSIPVNKMTRIDCVRCLKDSNVVIKLLVKHFPLRTQADEISNMQLSELCSKSAEDIPHVVSAEKKRTPPPPPPIPPRKIGRKSMKDIKVEVNIEPPPVPPARQSSALNSPVKILPSHRLQSPRSSGRHGDAHLSSGPPDAEVYLDLFAQEQEYSLRTESESDDTGSSISTIVDRLGSFPTTSNSSFSDSLPSTPTALKKRMDLALLNPFDVDDYLVTKLMSSENVDELKVAELKRGINLQPPASFQDAPLSCGNEDVRVMEAGLIMTKINNNNSCEEILHESNVSEIQVKNMRNLDNEKEIKKTEVTFRSGKKRPPPPPPTVSKEMPAFEKNNNYIKADESLQFNLPRLVDFVPKRSPSDENLNCMEEVVKTFLENEIKSTSGYECLEYRSKIENNCDNETGYFWTPCSQLATIGEDEEENNLDCLDQNSKSQKTSIIITDVLENVDQPNLKGDENNFKDDAGNKHEVDKTMEQQETYFRRSLSNLESCATNSDSDGTMEVPPSSSRQPPDGDEFPISYQENTSVINETPPRVTSVPKPVLPFNYNSVEDSKPKQVSIRSSNKDKKVTSVKDRIAIFSAQVQEVPSTLTANSKFSRIHKSSDDVFKSVDQTDFSNDPSSQPEATVVMFGNENKAENTNTALNEYFSLTEKREQDAAIEFKNKTPRLHTRSQSLVDVASLDQNMKSDKWNILMEQRRKGMSKLKGLVIPERVAEVESQLEPVIDLPEIQSKDSPASLTEFRTSDVKDNRKPPVHQRNLSNPCFVIPPLNSNVVPKYSPAFKRKSLQVYSVPNTLPKQTTNKDPKYSYYTTENTFTTECHLPVTSLPKTLPLNDAPKSLESITSPTRSDCSFEYICSSPDLKNTVKAQTNSKVYSPQEIKSVTKSVPPSHLKDNLDGSENESDNDSAVSSSQSSYCRCSPPMSPNDLQSNSSAYNVYETSSTVFLSSSECDKSTDDQDDSYSELQGSSKYNSLSRRVLKAQSVDAINRKNILASAKCRSGRDLKVGSPLIQRKFDEDGNAVVEKKAEQENEKQAVHYSVAAAASNADLQHINIAYVNIDETASAMDLLEEPKEIPLPAAVVTEENGTEHGQVPVVSYKKDVRVEKERKEQNNNISNTPANHIENYKSAKEDLKKVVLSKRTSIETSVKSKASNAKASVNDIKKSFEKMTPVPALRHSITSPKISTPVTPTKRLSLDSKSLKSQLHTSSPSNSSTSITTTPKTVPNNNNKDEKGNNVEISKQTIEELIKENNIGDKLEVIVVNLRRESAELSIGITLAGGSDYETKEITVHSVRKGSPAYHNGEIQKGDRILAINDKSMKGITHAESIALLKSPCLQVSLVVQKNKNITTSTPTTVTSPRRSSVSTSTNKTKDSPTKAAQSNDKGASFEVCLSKDIGGLGFSISGGHDSPLGDMPLLIKKLFKGGVAEKCGKLQEGDQLLAVNDVDVSNMSRIEAWGLMKKIPEGSSVKLTVKR